MSETQRAVAPWGCNSINNIRRSLKIITTTITQKIRREKTYRKRKVYESLTTEIKRKVMIFTMISHTMQEAVKVWVSSLHLTLILTS
jgi:hypothetical protein